jgi:hypothetical protein
MDIETDDVGGDGHVFGGDGHQAYESITGESELLLLSITMTTFSDSFVA